MGSLRNGYRSCGDSFGAQDFMDDQRHSEAKLRRNWKRPWIFANDWPVCEPAPFVGWDKRQRWPTIHSIWWAGAPLVPPYKFASWPTVGFCLTASRLGDRGEPAFAIPLARKKTRHPHFEFAAFMSIRVSDAGFGRDSQFCLESLPAESNGLSEFRLKCLIQHFTLAEETTGNERHTTKRKLALLLNSAAF